MKDLNIEYFEKIQGAYNEETASSRNWADSKVREIQDYLNAGNAIRITEYHNVIEIKSVTEMNAWIKNKNHLKFKFDKKLDLNQSINKLNINIGRYQVCKIKLTEEESQNKLLLSTDLHISLSAPNGKSFYVGIKNVVFNDFGAEESIINLQNLYCRLLTTVDIDIENLIKGLGNHIFISFEFYNLDKNTYEKKVVVGRELEN